MNAKSKLLVLLILLVAGCVAYRISVGDRKVRVEESPGVADSIDSSSFGGNIVEAGGGSEFSGNASLDPVLERRTGAKQSKLPTLVDLRHDCKAWLRRLGYDDSVERDSGR